jgi:hypothetical protein
MSVAKGKPDGRETPPAPQPQTFLSLAGRATPLELIVRILNATGADGFGRVLTHHDSSGNDID